MSDEKDNTQMPEPANDAAPVDDGQEIPGAGVTPEQQLELWDWGKLWKSAVG